MGFIQKRDDEQDEFGDLEVIGRGEGPDGLEESPIELHEGLTAEDISGTTAAREADRELEADPELLDADADADADTEWADAEEADASDDAAESDDEEAESDGKATEADANDEAAAVETGDDAEGNATMNEDTDMDTKDALNEKDASGEDSAHPEAPAGDQADSASNSNRTKLFAAIGLVAVIAAGIIGFFAGSGGFGSKGLSSSSVAEDQLNTVVATWTLNGAKHEVTAREAIETQYSLEAVEQDDGTYPAPSADTILAYVRNQVMIADAEAQGITVSDDELSAAAEDSLGTSDFSEIAEKYGVSEDQAKEIVRQQTIIQKLYGTVVTDAPTAPTAPEEPADGDTSAATAEYAAYILELAGDEWDADAKAWADEDGAYAQALSGTDFTGDTATYAQAQSAYYVAYQSYVSESSSAKSEWTEYVNKLFANTDLSLYGLFA